jgi:hypothetical protein
MATTTYVYFIQEKAGGPIKIGFSKDPQKRLSEIQTGYPRELMILAIMPGGRVQEREIHRRFGMNRMFGEWFKDDEKLMKFVLEVRSKMETD